MNFHNLIHSQAVLCASPSVPRPAPHGIEAAYSKMPQKHHQLLASQRGMRVNLRLYNGSKCKA